MMVIASKIWKGRQAQEVTLTFKLFTGLGRALQYGRFVNRKSIPSEV